MSEDSLLTSPLKTHSCTGYDEGQPPPSATTATGLLPRQAGAGQGAVTALCCSGAGAPGPGAAGAFSCSRWWWWLKILWQALPPLPLPPAPLLPPVKAPPRAAVASSSQGSSTSPSSLLGLWSLRRERIFSPVIAAATRRAGSGKLTAGRAGAAAAAPGDYRGGRDPRTQHELPGRPRARDTRIARGQRPSSGTRKAAAREPTSRRRGPPRPPPHTERPGAAIFPRLLSRELRRKRRGKLAGPPALAPLSGQRPQSPSTGFHPGPGPTGGDPDSGI